MDEPHEYGDLLSRLDPPPAFWALVVLVIIVSLLLIIKIARNDPADERLKESEERWRRADP